MRAVSERSHLLDAGESAASRSAPAAATGRPPLPSPRTGPSRPVARRTAHKRHLDKATRATSIPDNVGGSASDGDQRRRPYHYHKIPGTNRYLSDSGTDASDSEVANYTRFTYLSRVMSSSRLYRSDSEVNSESDCSSTFDPPHFTIPSHLIPAEFFIPFVRTRSDGEESSNSSLVTVFAIWNTMMGTSILSMPWLIQQSGLVTSIMAFLLMGLVCVFTAYRVLTMHACLRVQSPIEDFQCVMRCILSKHWEYVAIIFSVCVLTGAMLVYWVLMSNFLFNSVEFFYDLATGNFSQFVVNSTVIRGAYCPDDEVHSGLLYILQSNIYEQLWNRTTSPLFLVLILFPLLNIKSPTFFTKFTGLGTISVIYMTMFVTVKSAQFGIHVSFSDPSQKDYVQLFRSNFPVALGTLSLAMFIHNCICRIMESNEHQQNNVRDLLIAYFLVFATYLYIGLLFFLAWPFAKSCIRDNFLDNFVGTDIMSLVARLFLLFQMCTVFPLLGFMLRAQLMTFIYGTTYPGAGRVLLLNTCLVVACVVIAIFYPYIGQLLRFSGAFCGMAWIFTFPCVVYMVGKYRNGELRWPAALLHSSLIVLGSVNLILQFTVTTD